MLLIIMALLLIGGMLLYASITGKNFSGLVTQWTQK